MRTTLAVLSAATVLATFSQAEARGGRIRLFSTKAHVAPALNGLAKAGPQAAADAKRGGGLVVLPLPGRAARTASAPSEAESAGQPGQTGSEVLDITTASTVPAAEEPGGRAPAEARPWCEDGTVVGSGAGICVLALKRELRGAPAILSVSN